MTQDEKNRLSELRSQGTLSREQVDDYVRLVDLEREGAKSIKKEEVVIEEDKPTRGRPPKK